MARSALGWHHEIVVLGERGGGDAADERRPGRHGKVS
jgi:hypothetical protein